MDETTLQIIWFAIIAVLFAGYFVLEGYDFGVQMNLAIIGRGRDNAKRRKAMLETIGPVWDGNQVWLITGGASIFAAFPYWYATLFSGFYLALLALVLVLIARVCAFKYRSKSTSYRWTRNWDTVHIIGGFVPAFLWGVAFANIVQGVVINDKQFVTTTLFGLLNPFGLLGGITFVLLFLLQGTTYLAIKTEGSLRADANRLVPKVAIPTIIAGATFLIWNQFANSNSAFTWIPLLLAAVALVASVVFNRMGREGLAFSSTSLAILSAGVQMFGGLYPNVLPATNKAANTLTVFNSSSTHYTLTVMLLGVVFLLPVVLAYQAWAFWVFRHRVDPDHLDDPNARPRTLAERARAGYKAALDQNTN